MTETLSDAFDAIYDSIFTPELALELAGPKKKLFAGPLSPISSTTIQLRWGPSKVRSPML